jgi:hypothetical protein
MSDVRKYIHELLELKTKAFNGVNWSAEEKAHIQKLLQDQGNIGVLAACCVLASQRCREFPGSLEIVCKALGREHLPSYVELSIYEALINVEVRQLEPLFVEILSFVESTISRRAINLDNTICLLGKLSYAGDRQALSLLQSLACDNDPAVRDSAASHPINRK